MTNIKNKKINHCFGASLQIVFDSFEIPESRIIPYPKFLLVDNEQNVDTMEGILHSLICEVKKEEFIENYKSEGIVFKHEYKLNAKEIQNNLQTGYMLFMVDVYRCPWCKFYQKIHYDHICVLTFGGNGKAKIVDYIFQKEPIVVDIELIVQIGKSFFWIIKWQKTISYEKVLRKQVYNMIKYNKFHVQSQNLIEILLDKRDYINREFYLENPVSFFIVNFFKQFSEEIVLHNQFINQCVLEDIKYYELYRLNEESQKILNNITYNFIKLSMSSSNKKIIYFDKIITCIEKLYSNECNKKNFLESLLINSKKNCEEDND